MKKTFEDLQKQHDELLNSLDHGEDKLLLIESVKKYFQDVEESSSNIVSPSEREQLRANLRYWAAFRLDQEGEFPQVQLRPVNPNFRKEQEILNKPLHNDSSKLKIIIGSILVIIILIIFILTLIFYPSQPDDPKYFGLVTLTVTPTNTLTVIPTITSRVFLPMMNPSVTPTGTPTPESIDIPCGKNDTASPGINSKWELASGCFWLCSGDFYLISDKKDINLFELIPRVDEQRTGMLLIVEPDNIAPIYSNYGGSCRSYKNDGDLIIAKEILIEELFSNSCYNNQGCTNINVYKLSLKGYEFIENRINSIINIK